MPPRRSSSLFLAVHSATPPCDVRLRFFSGSRKPPLSSGSAAAPLVVAASGCSDISLDVCWQQQQQRERRWQTRTEQLSVCAVVVWLDAGTADVTARATQLPPHPRCNCYVTGGELWSGADRGRWGCGSATGAYLSGVTGDLGIATEKNVLKYKSFTKF